jgi:hypothetical protein
MLLIMLLLLLGKLLYSILQLLDCRLLLHQAVLLLLYKCRQVLHAALQLLHITSSTADGPLVVQQPRGAVQLQGVAAIAAATAVATAIGCGSTADPE